MTRGGRGQTKLLRLECEAQFSQMEFPGSFLRKARTAVPANLPKDSAAQRQLYLPGSLMTVQLLQTHQIYYGVMPARWQTRQLQVLLPQRDTELTTIYAPEYLCDNSRDQMRNYSLQIIVKPRRDSHKWGRKTGSI